MRKLFAIMSMTLCIAGCIENDLSYPRIPVEITSFEVEGQKSVAIDAAAKTVEVVLEETADIRALTVKSFVYTAEAELLTALPETLDLSQPLTLKFRTYQDYEWTLSATQPIERYIEVENQAGETEFDLNERIAYVYVAEEQDLMSVTFNDMKLEAEGSVVSSTTGQISVGGEAVEETLECLFPMTLDCVVMRTFSVEYNGETVQWSVKVLNKIVELEVSSVNAWCYSADVKAVSKGGAASVLEYKTSSASKWTVIEDVTVDGTSLTGRISRLKAGTQYLARVWNGEDVSEEFSFKTDTPVQLPNMNFDLWYQGNPNSSWYPCAEGDPNPVWGTANPGTNFTGTVNPTRPEYGHVVTPGGAAARVESISALGMFAAGNIFTGEFVDVTLAGGVSANLLWGTPFTSRPYSLKGYYDYSPKVVDNAPEKVNGVSGSNPYKDQMGKNDHCQILAVLFADGEGEDQKGPYKVSSAKPGVPDLMNDSRVIAYGALESDESTGGEYVEFECVLEYRDDRKPDYAIVVACSSLRGDFFTGALGSVMYVDDFEFIYK